MSFYKQISSYYHHIFKINPKQVDFIKQKIPNNNADIIDVGCGIGTLSFELINNYKNVIGLDMDAEMIRVALKKNEKLNSSVQFQKLSMLELNTSFNDKSMDGIICFGNTLVHLNSLDQVSQFFKQAKNALKSDGKLLFQIVNYDRILSKNIKQLPIIDNDEILFERNYNYRKAQDEIDFNTKLTVKSTKQIIENSIVLLPLLKKDITDLLIKAGFHNCIYFGNFNQELYTVNSPALIVEAW